MATIKLPVAFVESAKKFVGYPLNLAKEGFGGRVLAEYKKRLSDREQGLDLFGPLGESFIPFQEVSKTGVVQQGNLVSEAKLWEWLDNDYIPDATDNKKLPVAKPDPLPRYIFFTVDESTSPLEMSSTSLRRILSHFQVMPSYLDLVHTFSGRCGEDKGVGQSHFRASDSGAKYRKIATGDINGRQIDAVADTGSGLNVISSVLAELLGLRPAAGTERPIKMASGPIVKTLGNVEVNWRFGNEEKEYRLTCAVLPNFVHDLLLGNGFLRLSGSLDSLKHRIKKVFTGFAKRLSVELLNDDQERICGYFNGHKALAIADSASDGMFIGGDYARRLGFEIDRHPRNRAEIRLPNGSRTFTSGIVKGIEWKFRAGESGILCDFFVLDDLPVDIILSNNFIDTFDVYSRYGDCFVGIGVGGDEPSAEMFDIKVVGNYNETLQCLMDDYMADLSSENPFSQEMVRKESARRSEVRAELRKLSGTQGGDAQREETERQHDWERRRDLYRQANSNLEETAANTTTSSGAVLNPAPTLPTTILPISRLKFWRKRGSSIPLLPLWRQK